MMPGPNGPGRRQNDYQYAYPPQAHPTYYHPQAQYYPQPPPAPHYPQQWYPQQPYPPQPYPQAPRHYQQYAPPMPHQQQHAPLVVSSHPHHLQPHYSHTPQAQMVRPHLPTTPVTHAQLPVQALPFTPAVPYNLSTASLPLQSPVPSAASDRPASPPSKPAASQEHAIPAAPLESVESEVMVPVTEPFEAPVSIHQPVAKHRTNAIKLPWLSVPDHPFPPPARRRRRKQGYVAASAPGVELPTREGESPAAEEPVEAGDVTEEQTESQASTVAGPSEQGTPATSQAPSEAGEPPTTPTSIVQTAAVSNHARAPTRPVIPIIPKIPASATRQQATSSRAETLKATAPLLPPVVAEAAKSTDATIPEPSSATTATTEDAAPAPAVKVSQKSWADLVRSKNAAAAAATPTSNGVVSGSQGAASGATNVAEAVRTFSVDSAQKVPFIMPRGLVNSGNMCYMNSVLQTLAFCTPFYDFIDLVDKRMAHSFKSDTLLLDSMILFLREYPIIDSASSVEQLRMRLKSEELEQFGDAFTPDNVYDAIKRLPRFSTMRRGHQQDAEEFLIFFLEQLHDECVKIINSIPISAVESAQPLSPASETLSAADAGWQEVGHKQKAAIMNNSGHTYNDTPVTKIFGGTLRSELRVPGKKNSVTFQPYQPLQLDIGAPEVHNIIDALKGLTRSETIYGDFNSPRGPEVAATKQIFIETLPPVLILHLKRFEYNNMGGTQKIWKKVGYPLELIIPKEVFPQQKRSQMAISGLPKYRLEGVIYHHGKNASSGHYTVDLRRQEGREWIRVDDTIIRRLRAEDVAEGGAEEDPKFLARVLEEHGNDTVNKPGNLFDQFGAMDEDAQSEGGWNTAGAKEAGAKKWAAVANGTATPSSAGAKTPRKENVKDNKVAYILFYRRV